jgi:light-independent protochlorophyllide reductase subunit B
MGAEGANVIFDTWVHPLMMGLEEHLLGMFREDFEFADGASPSHLGHGHAAPVVAVERESVAAPVVDAEAVATLDAPPGQLVWGPDAEAELKKIPFFVRGKARRNTERYATEHGITAISLETLYEAKAHFSR